MKVLPDKDLQSFFTKQVQDYGSNNYMTEHSGSTQWDIRCDKPPK
ncbi:MAG: hypothetical protein AAF208_05635 [Cyanobacteria bacterium P01_A01_bin.45]